MTILTIGFATPLSSLFTHGDNGLLDLTSSGMRLYGISFLLAGLNIYASSFFTSLNDGLVSAVISFARTLVFQVIAILVMPILFGTTGIWLSIVVAEVLAIIVSIVCLIVKKKKYRY
jgi:Na+-driven multidrug efflux pump